MRSTGQGAETPQQKLARENRLEKKAKEEQERAKQEREEIRALLGTKGGKTLLAYLEARFDRSLMGRSETGAVDAYQMAVNVGAREVVVELREIRDTQDREEA